MKTLIFSLLCCIAFSQTRASDEQYIPVALEAALPTIRAGMSIQEVETILSVAYHHVSHRGGPWSGSSGYVYYDLDKPIVLGVEFEFSSHGKIVTDKPFFAVTDTASKHRWEIRSDDHGHLREIRIYDYLHPSK